MQIIILLLNLDQIMNFLYFNFLNIIYYKLKILNLHLHHFPYNNKLKTLYKIHFKLLFHNLY